MVLLDVISQLWFWWSIKSSQKKMFRAEARLQRQCLNVAVSTSWISSAAPERDPSPHLPADVLKYEQNGGL